MKRTLTIIFLFILTLSLLLCGCDSNSKKEEENPIIKKNEIRQDGDTVTVVYEDGYEHNYSLTQPIDVLVEKEGTRIVRAIGSSFFYFTSSGNNLTVTITPGSTITGTGGYYSEESGVGDYVISGDTFIGTASRVPVQNAALYLEHDGKKYEDCSSELLTLFRANTTLIDFFTGYEKEPFETIDANGFTKFEKLEAIILPTSIKEVGRNAFDGCTKLTTVYYYGTPAEWENVELVGTKKTDKEDKEKVETIPNLLESCTVYFYSEEAPTATGNYWHLVDGKPTAW